MILETLYVRMMRILRHLARSWGILTLLEKGSPGSARLWLRSLFAIHDVDDLIGLDLPWWTLESTGLVERFLARRSDASVFEFGSGASTVWLAKRANRVASVEHDPRWVETMALRLISFNNVTLRSPNLGDGLTEGATHSERRGWTAPDFRPYVAEVASGGPWDLVVIDGRCRVACLHASIPHLKPDGIILFDNSNRRRYRNGIASSGLVRLCTRGKTVSLPYPEETSLLARRLEWLDPG